MAQCPQSLAGCGPVLLLGQSPADTWVVIPQPLPRQAPPHPQQQAGADDPHGVLSWLRKIKSMLEHPAATAPVYC